MPVPAVVSELVERFHLHREQYRTGRFNETQLRRDFLDPFFETLGWDVSNKAGYAEAYRDVLHEDAIKIGGATKAPDYCFRIGGTRKFFVEAKKPGVDLKNDPAPAYQLRRYAWSAKLPLSILTDFEEFVVYDCRVRPEVGEKASVARILYMEYGDFVSRWDEIEGVFSRDAILKGAFDKYAESTKKKRGTTEVDDAFLAEIEGWREKLAKNLALRNSGLGIRELNYAVQKTIDRIVFLRICEDRGIEDYGRLQALQNGPKVYARLTQLFEAADDRYNSGLFHFHREKNRAEPADEWTLSLEIDDKPLKDILKHLYYPDSPYEFSVLPADILGQVYERFLGKVIRLTGGSAKVEEKPEVRKAGGVYYTPTYIVEYIVEHTVGSLLEGAEVKKVERKDRHLDRLLRVLDPACGSGSFLLVAYQRLLDWHLAWYLKHEPLKLAATANPPVRLDSKGAWRLTTAERKRILLDHIFGVDIDSQAVEVTKLSLLLKVLEGETREALQRQLFARERALPDLASNIKCGNSLIGPDFYRQRQLSLLDDEERFRVNVFDWPTEFSEITRTGGFDAVIGNPPYLNIDDTWGKDDPRQKYLKDAYPHVYNDKTDILFYFLARAVELSQGHVSFIVSRAFLEAYKADKLRGWLSSNTEIVEIVDFRNLYVFPRVGITTAIVHLNKAGKEERAADIFRLTDDVFSVPAGGGLVTRDDSFQHLQSPQQAFTSSPWVFAQLDVQNILDKIDAHGTAIGEWLVIGQGMQTGRNNVFGKLTTQDVRDWRLPQSSYYLRARNSDIQQYHIEDSGEVLLYLEDVESFSDLPARVQDHLKRHEAVLKERAAYQRGNCEWWRYTWPLHKSHMHSDKIYCPYLATYNRFAMDAQRAYLGLTDTTVIFDAGQPEDLRYVMAVLNSRLLTFRFKFIGKLKSGGILEYFWNSISKLHVPRVREGDSAAQARHESLVQLAASLTLLREKMTVERVASAKSAILRQIAATHRQVDDIVYQLYALTAAEIRHVEAATSPGDIP